MKKTLLFSFMVLFVFAYAEGQIFIGKSGEASFFSEAALEDITASTQKVYSMLNTANGDLVVLIPVATFEFEKSLMQEHFNEKYLETGKFPRASFNGRITEQIDFKKQGRWPVTVEGQLTLHGVKRNYKIEGFISVKDGTVSYSTEFDIVLKDHEIKRPKVVFDNIAETVKVRVSADLKVYK